MNIPNNSPTPLYLSGDKSLFDILYTEGHSPKQVPITRWHHSVPNLKLSLDVLRKWRINALASSRLCLSELLHHRLARVLEALGIYLEKTTSHSYIESPMSRLIIPERDHVAGQIDMLFVFTSYTRRRRRKLGARRANLIPDGGCGCSHVSLDV